MVELLRSIPFELRSLAEAIALVLVHIFVGRVVFRSETGRDAWLAAGGGAAVAYSFLVLLPKIAAAQLLLAQDDTADWTGFREHHSYLAALAGLCSMYALDVAANRLQSIVRRPASRIERLRLSAAWTSLLTLDALGFSLYAMLAAYTLSLRPGRQALSQLLSAAVIVAHFLVIDYKLHASLGLFYQRYVRWSLAGATLLGWGLAQPAPVSYEAVALWNSAFAGALLMSALREKVPEARQVRMGPFLAGVGAASGLVIASKALETISG